MTSTNPNTYRGRFAPSPTGPLHFGSMVAAVASYLQARSQQGVWLLRIEDLDPPREVPGAAHAMLTTLERFGLHWDEEVLYQSRRSEAYRAALDQLAQRGVLYPCGCSRKEIAAQATAGPGGPIYGGSCRAGLASGKEPRALRIRTHNRSITFVDRLRGRVTQRLEEEVGDFVVRRADGLFAYQLAVVVDDAWQGVTEVVRGSDLLDNTPRQIHLQQLLNYPTPAYLHLPLALNSAGEKLSKQNGARPIDQDRPQTVLMATLHFLNQAPPAELVEASLDELWRWAIDHWSLARVPGVDIPVAPD